MITSGDLIRQERKKAGGLSQKEVAANLGGTTHTAISLIEKNLRYHTLKKLTDVLSKGIGLDEKEAKKTATIGMMLDLINDVEDREAVLGKFIELAMK